MRAWRIANSRFALDRSCIGAITHGGRWNPIGMPMLYAASSISLAAVERLVHLGHSPWPEQELVAIDFPDSAEIYRPSHDVLPARWDAMPTSSAAQAFGRAWLIDGTSLAMAVPSVVIPEQVNILLNPMHPEFSQVVLTRLRPFALDLRLPT